MRTLLLLGFSAIAGCGGAKGMVSTQVPPPTQCSGYQVKTQVTDEAIKVTVAKGAPIVELSYKKIAGSSTYELQTITPPDKLSDPGPPATATVTGPKVCFAWSADDTSTDPCLQAVQKSEWCVTTQ